MRRVPMHYFLAEQGRVKIAGNTKGHNEASVVIRDALKRIYLLISPVLLRYTYVIVVVSSHVKLGM